MVGPVHPIPPHCPHFAADPPPPLEEVLAGVLEVVEEALPLVTL